MTFRHGAADARPIQTISLCLYADADGTPRIEAGYATGIRLLPHPLNQYQMRLSRGRRPATASPQDIIMAIKNEDEADLTGVAARTKPKPSVEKIGDRKLKPSTLMMGHGYDPMLFEGSLKPPIFLTSTFVFPNAAAGKRHFEGVTGKRPGGADGLVYSRFNGPNQEILEDRLGIWDEAEDALTFSSGMSAIATMLLALVKPGDVIVHSAPLYAATETLIGRILGKFGVTWLDFPAG